MVDKTYKIYESKGQFKITLPKVLAQSIGMEKGDLITYIIDRGDLVVKKVRK